jgi:Sulfotransferase family
MVDRRGAVCRSPDFIYFRIPKAANSTITLTLQGLLNAGTVERPDRAKALFLPLHTLSQDDVERLKERFFTFTFVRNPFTRIASAYLSKVEDSDKQKIHVARWYGRGLHDPVSFREFCTYLRDGRGYLDDGHWARQVDLITLPVDQLDFIGKIESLDQDLRHVIKAVFGSDRELQIKSWSMHTTGASAKVRELYGEREMDIVREVYTEDFRVFGYDPLCLP